MIPASNILLLPTSITLLNQRLHRQCFITSLVFVLHILQLSELVVEIEFTYNSFLEFALLLQLVHVYLKVVLDVSLMHLYLPVVLAQIAPGSWWVHLGKIRATFLLVHWRLWSWKGCLFLLGVDRAFAIHFFISGVCIIFHGYLLLCASHFINVAIIGYVFLFHAQVGRVWKHRRAAALLVPVERWNLRQIVRPWYFRGKYFLSSCLRDPGLIELIVVTEQVWDVDQIIW